MNNADQPASPTYWPRYGDKGQVIAWVPHGGMTKREEFAKAALSGLLASIVTTGRVAEFAKWSVEFADALLAELAKDQT